MAEFAVHNVHEIRVSADATPVDFGAGALRPSYWQTLVLLDEQGEELGTVVLFLSDPTVALPIGDAPPYWGVDPSKAPLDRDGESPF